jgi:hypothetical protein
MPTQEEIEETAQTILDDALAPQIIEGDMGKLQEYSIDDKIKAAAFQAGNSANARGGIRISKIVPPNSNGM